MRVFRKVSRMQFDTMLTRTSSPSITMTWSSKYWPEITRPRQSGSRMSTFPGSLRQKWLLTFSLDLTLSTSQGGWRHPMGQTWTWGSLLETICYYWPGEKWVQKFGQITNNTFCLGILWEDGMAHIFRPKEAGGRHQEKWGRELQAGEENGLSSWSLLLSKFSWQDMSEAEKRRNKEHKEINSEVK